MSQEPSTVSRRSFLSANAVLLAGFSLGAAGLTTVPAYAAGRKPAAGAPEDLALYRPVAVSSTDYAPTPAEFVVDRLARTGVKGSGWRAAQGDNQWISVDLQAPCRIESVTLVFEAKDGDPTFVPSTGGQPRSDTVGTEILSSAAVAFTIEVSDDGKTWRTVHSTTSGTGGETAIPLSEPAVARWVRLSATKRSNGNPLGLNSFQVYGTSEHERPQAHGWTSWKGRGGAAPALSVSDDGTVPLESGWDLTMDDFAGSADGAALSGPSVDTGEWLPATVPGTVLATLVEQGHFPDPVSGFNNMRIPEALSRHSWWYRRAFALPGGFEAGAGRHVWLEFDGINHHADIWINGAKAGELTSPFARTALDIAEHLLPGGKEQVLAVGITPMPHPGSPADKGPDGNAFVQSAKIYLDSPTDLAVSGWDWIPAIRDRVSGIWNHVRLRSTGDAVIGDARVVSKLPDSPDVSRAEVTITVPVRNAGSVTRSVTVDAAFGKVKVSRKVSVGAGESTEVTFAPADFPQLELRDPELWWPNGYGEPYLYDLTMTATVSGARSDRRSVRFGIREFTYTHEQPVVFPPGQDFFRQTVDLGARQARHVRVLGGRRATGWGISMWGLTVTASSAPGTDLALHRTVTSSSVDDPGNKPENAVDGDATTRWSSAYNDGEWIQVDLGGSVSFDTVAIDWQEAYAADFTVQVSDDAKTWTDAKEVSNATTPLKIIVNGVPVFCRGGNWGWDELLRRMPAERMNAVIRMHRDMNFTMIRNWIGSSNREEFFAACDENGILVWNDFWEAGPFLDEIPDYVDIARDTIRRFRTHPCIAVWCAANEENPPQTIGAGLLKAITEEDDEIFYLANSADGTVSGHGPYYYVEPEAYFDKKTYDTGNFGFHTEIGIPTVSVTESMKNLVGDAQEWPIGDVWFNHDWSANGNQRPAAYKDAIDARLGESTSLDEFSRKAQFINYENVRAMFEAWNQNLWNDARALLLWMSHPAWHSTVWQTYDYDMDVNGTYYGARKGCEPVHVQASRADWRVVVANHTTKTLKGVTVTARLHDLDGKALGDPVRQTTDAGPSSSVELFTAGWTDALPALHLLRLVATGADGTVLSENTYWRYRTAGDMKALNTLRETRVSVGLGRTVREGTRRSLKVTAHNTGSAVAAMVRLGLRDKVSDQRVLPTLYEDNYLWLLPDEKREITLSWEADALGSGRPLVTLEGHNVTATRTS
jgi:hypothetical protein